ERVDQRAPWVVRRLPGGCLLLQIERRRREIDVRIDLARVDGRWDLSVLELQQDLRHARDAGGRFRMADVGFHRADGAELSPLRTATERLGQRHDLETIAELRAGAMAFHVTDGFGMDVRLAQSLVD